MLLVTTYEDEKPQKNMTHTLDILGKVCYNIRMSIRFKTHLAGTSQRYFVLSLWHEGKCISTATSTSLSYIRKVKSRYQAKVESFKSQAFLQA